MSPSRRKRKSASVDELVEGVLSFDRAMLGRAITMVESRSPLHADTAATILDRVMLAGRTGKRIGITGVPGVGKSTLIEALGGLLLNHGLKVAVIAVDPSSSISGGSILGDKTRMEQLVRHQNCFIRPVPSKGTLGGVAQHTMETILLCEAAGFDVILVETVGVGQNEATVRELVDYFLLLMLPNAGDNLQGIKRGIMELADGIVINKADANKLDAAVLAKGEYEHALEFLRPATNGWKTGVSLCSALEQSGIEEIWQNALHFFHTTENSGELFNRRARQRQAWLRMRITHQLQTTFFGNDAVQAELASVEKEFVRGGVTLSDAIAKVLQKGGFKPPE